MDAIQWVQATATIQGPDGKTIFQQEGVEVPADWSQQAIDTVASKYFRGALDTEERETSVRGLIGRVVDTIATWAKEDGYFDDDDGVSLANFHADLKWLIVHQYATFNSPVWFNVGFSDHPQGSACFILSVDDTMESILDLAKTEGLIFRDGSGCGTNLSTLRSTHDRLSGGGRPSGPVSFMKGYDAFAGVIKSGGKVRRAAKMQILDVDHPDIVEFIEAKALEERKAHALAAAGFSANMDGEAYGSVFFQNANLSVRASDAFMEAVEQDGDWDLRLVLNGRDVVETIKARELLRRIATGTHTCGDPGMLFGDNINRWNPMAQEGSVIRASNPCGEFLCVDNSACNLASLNLLRFWDRAKGFAVSQFKNAVRIFITAMDAIVHRAKYPTPEVTANSHRYRPLGLGYANLGALLMAAGTPYDSDAGRTLAANVTSLLTAEAYLTSAGIASDRGPCEAWAPNRQSMRDVIARHQQASTKLVTAPIPNGDELGEAQGGSWDRVLAYADKEDCDGFANLQTSLLAPTGTVAFMMDCDTTGIEPEIALVRRKDLAGGGTMILSNRTVVVGLEALGYTPTEIEGITKHLELLKTIEGAPGLRPEHEAVFDCAFKPLNGKRFIRPSGHIGMMAAVQPFLSMGISKTVNMPREATVEDIEKTYIDAWERGLKAVAIYRDGSKVTQAVTAAGKVDRTGPNYGPPKMPERHRLATKRRSETHKFQIANHEGYATIGFYPNGKVAEIFLKMAKEGSTVSGFLDSFATAMSMMLQSGIPIEVLIRKFAFSRFEPAGRSTDTRVGYARSPIDYIMRYIDHEYYGGTVINPEVNGGRHDTGVFDQKEVEAKLKGMLSKEGPQALAGIVEVHDTKPCSKCGDIAIRVGRCYRCLSCKTSDGCD